ncbi:MAG TPA: carboxypeptidase-like regulatory domain-containing protein [Pyrinomonadaceae bacterium]|nr:carboxypeptidase-like regulatory domain-containing protein [Pyrinomonadaceae bacterium]
MKKSCSFVVLTILIGYHCAWANSGLRADAESEAQVKGVIVDWQDARIVNASIRIEAKNFRRDLNSDESGEFNVMLPIGTYRISVSHPVFKTFVIKKLTVSGSGMSGLRVILRVKTPTASGGKCPKGSLCL